MRNVGFLPNAERRLRLELRYLKKAHSREIPLLSYGIVEAIQAMADEIATDIAIHEIAVDVNFLALLQAVFDELSRVKKLMKGNPHG